jgi:hypothetical protein
MLDVSPRLFRLLVPALLVGCAPKPAPDPAPAMPPAAAFVGRQTCAGCHGQEDRLWQGSHHDLAMQEATPASVLGDFDGASLTHFGVTSTFSRRDGKLFVRTDGPDGRLHDFRVAYTFGVFPLQQYLIEMPGGRLQALPLCWDARPAAEGGQRWFHLHPDEPVPAGDALHWTGPNQTWNYMCADCHSTGLRKGWRAGKNVYETTWAEIDVSCEACHGPGSRHVAWARGDRKTDGNGKGFAVRLADPGRGTWIADPATGKGRRLAPAVATDEVETCARCHSSRAVISDQGVEPGRPLLDSYRPALLDEGFYHADGQIDGEVYEVGSFLQSRMHAAGVTCSDCHEPHALTLRRSGNALCTHCHSAPKFDTPAHHHHAARGAQCVDCHMPEKTYMVVDTRRDHSLRVPRPGPARKPHWGEAIQAGRESRPGAGAALAAVAVDSDVPAIARATALSLLRRNPGPESLSAIQAGLRDADPLVRLGAALAVEALDPGARLRLASPLLADPVRGVRIEAARILAGSGAPGLEAALAEYRIAQEVNADRPESQLNLGWLAAVRGDLAGAEAACRSALRLDPSYAPARVNLADLLRLQGRDAEGEAVLRQALALAPRDASVHHALGLLLVRTGRLDEALPELGRAVELAPSEARYAYVYRAAVNGR